MKAYSGVWRKSVSHSLYGPPLYSDRCYLVPWVVALERFHCNEKHNRFYKIKHVILPFWNSLTRRATHKRTIIEQSQLQKYKKMYKAT